jgi:AAA domain
MARHTYRQYKVEALPLTVIDFNKARQQGEPEPGRVDAENIRKRLHADPAGFVQWLFSGRALISKGEARVGNVYGEPGASLSIKLSGADAGLWKDHATDEGGDLISLYRACMGYTEKVDFGLSLKEIAKDYLGDPEIDIPHSPWQPSATERINKQKEKLGTKPREDMLELGAPVATWKYYDTHGTMIAAVHRYEPDGDPAKKTFRPYCHKTIDGKTKWMMGAPDKRPLYRLPDIATKSIIVLVEGEKCAQALADIGIEATTAMQGARAPVDQTDWSPLYNKTVVIWPDKDAPGLEWAKNVSGYLAAHCKVLGVEPPEDKPEKWDAADCIKEGGDAAELIAGAKVYSEAPLKPKIRLLDIDQLEIMRPPSWLIQDIITEHGLSMIWGRSGSLKSFIALDMGLCIATGLDWHGRPVKKGCTVYLAAEGSHGLAGRAIGWRKSPERGGKLPKPNFHLIPHGLTLSSSSDLEAMIGAILPLKPTFIVIDTMSRTFGGGNPNQPADMNQFVHAADKLKDATGACVVIVHHGGKNTDNNELGNEGLRNACDTVIHVRRKAKSVELINEAPKGKQKDADEFKMIVLEPVKVFYDHAGEERSTLILNLKANNAEADDGAEVGVKDALKGLGSNQKKVVEAIKQVGTALGKNRLATMTGIATADLDRVLQGLVEKNLLKSEMDPSGNHAEWNLI